LDGDNLAIKQAQVKVSAAKNAIGKARQNATLAAPTAADLATAKASVAQAQQTVATAQQTLAGTELRSTQDGVVISLSGSVGQTAGSGSSSTGTSSSGSSSGSGGSGSGGSGAGSSGSGSSGSSSSGTSSSAFVVVSDPKQLAVTANIAEADISSVQLDQSVAVKVSATSKQLDGKVSAVSPTSTTSNNVVQYPVTVLIPNADGAVHLGATVSLVITTGSKSDVLYVSPNALTTRGTNHTVTVLVNGVPTITPVEVGLTGDNGVEIVSGLTAGQQVVLPTASTGTTGTNRTGTGAGTGRTGTGAGAGAGLGGLGAGR
jgi:multidrug efflux pump subunit AcrA (membrane-fusion protein)